MIRPAYLGSVRITEDDVQKAKADLAAEFGLSAAECHDAVLSRVTDRSTAAGWVLGIRAAYEALKATTPTSASSSMAQKISEYTERWPAYVGDQRVCLTAEQGNRPPIDAATAAAEISRITLTHNSRRTPFDLQKIAVAGLDNGQEVTLTEDRLYDDSSTLRLTSEAGDSQRDTDAEIARLTAEHSKYSTGLAAQGEADMVDVVDSRPEAESDLGDEQVLADVDESEGSWSPKAAGQLAGLDPTFRAMINGSLAAAEAEDDDPAVRDRYYATASYVARSNGAATLAGEINQRARVARLGASAVPSAADAEQQSAGGRTVDQQVADITDRNPQLFGKQTVATTGNRVD